MTESSIRFGEMSWVKELLENKVPTRMELFAYMEEKVYQLCIRIIFHGQRSKAKI